MLFCALPHSTSIAAPPFTNAELHARNTEDRDPHNLLESLQVERICRQKKHSEPAYPQLTWYCLQLSLHISVRVRFC
jgi:hypothetical protein